MELLTAFIPTLNSEKYIDIFLRYYRSVGLSVVVFVDQKTSDRTLSVAERWAPHVEKMFNPSPRINEMIHKISLQCGTKWVLRLDDDELPSEAMIRFVFSTISGSDPDAVGFIRHQCSVDRKGRIFRHLGHDSEMHRQWRLYQPGRVKPTGEGHKPGFIVESHHRRAPPEASMIHLDWMASSYSERLAKIDRYDAHTMGDGSRFRNYYLYEEQSDYRRQFVPLELPEFDEVGRSLAGRFPARCIPD